MKAWHSSKRDPELLLAVEEVSNGLVAHLSSGETGLSPNRYVASSPEEMKEVLSEVLEVHVNDMLGLAPGASADDGMVAPFLDRDF